MAFAYGKKPTGMLDPDTLAVELMIFNVILYSSVDEKAVTKQRRENLCWFRSNSAHQAGCLQTRCHGPQGAIVHISRVQNLASNVKCESPKRRMSLRSSLILDLHNVIGHQQRVWSMLNY